MTVRELHDHTGAIVSEAAAGNVVVIEKRGVPVAELRPAPTKPAKMTVAEHFRKLQALWDGMPQVPGDSTLTLSEDRDR